MAAPNKTDVVTMKFSKNGSPWVNIPAKSSIDPNTMAYSKDGSPWFGVSDSSSPPSSNIEKINELAYVSVGTFNALSMASVGSVNELA